MKKHLKIASFVLACSAALVLGACGSAESNSASSAASSADAQTSAQAEADAQASASSESAATSAAPDSSAAASSQEAATSASAAASADAFIGDWKLAALDYMGLKVAGDISEMTGWSGGSLTIAEDGSGAVALGEDSAQFSWQQAGDAAIAISIAGATDNASLESASELTLNDGVLFLVMDDEEATGGIYFTRDGNYPGAPEANIDGASPITNEDTLVGNWKLTAVTQGKAIIFGDSASLAQNMNLNDENLKFEAGGSGSFGGEGATWTVGANGAVVIDNVGTEVPVTALGDNIVLDIGAPYDLDMALVFAKA